MNPNAVRRNFAARCSALALSLGLALMPLLGHAQEPPKVKITTNMGEIMVELYPDKAPKTVANFLQYVRDKHYNGTIFHRVIANFMIQGGGYDAQYKERPTRAPVQHEGRQAMTAGLKNQTGFLAMARTNLFGYTVFGKVTSGMDVVDKIRTTPTGMGGPFRTDVPKTPVVIQSITLVQ